MKSYKLDDIFNIANQRYDLNLNSKKDPKKVRAIKTKIQRELAKEGKKPPYKLSYEEVTRLLNKINSYLLKQAIKINPSIILDNDKFQKMKAEKVPFTLTIEQAEIQIKLDFLIQLLTAKEGKETYFLKEDFKNNFLNLRNHIDNEGYPLPGYTNAESELFGNVQKYFMQLPKIQKNGDETK